ncbi:ribonuclease III [Patescibacteria group bacterium]|nr:ribonuclease III [Patescibacteria group bacterium]
MEQDFSQLEKNLNLKFKNKKLIKQALVHRSYLNEHPDFELAHNERLEFLGDAVLELVTTEYLYLNYPDHPEGEMTNWRAALVNTQMLASLSTELEVNDFLFLSHGEAKDTGKARELILANTFEAIIGACYLDRGYKTAKKFIVENALTKLPNILENKTYIDPKSRLQEETQDLYNLTPSYRVLEETGPDHDKYFVIGVHLKENLLGQGKGSSKQKAQVSAAKDALKKDKYKNLNLDRQE